jgi:lipid II:glycine glycyltransferase (peptidoglycan interpeptide bridge formation enzyme)
MIKIIDQKFPINYWEEKANHPLQSWFWGEARKKMGIEVLRFLEIKNHKILNVFQISFHRIPLLNKKIGYLPRSSFPSQEVLDFLYNYGKKNNLIFIKIEPYEEKSKFKSQKSKVINKKLVISKNPLFPSWTQILDLSKSEDEVLKSFHPKTRYNIRLAQKKGVIVKEESDSKGFKIFAKLYFDTCQRQKYFGHNHQYHQIVWESLKNKIAHILIAYYKNEPLAAYQIWLHKNIAYYPYGGSSEKYRNLMGTNLLMWEAIKLAKKLGAKTFDMWGSLPPNYSPKHPWAGFTRFKQGYGGKFVEMVGSFDLLINPLFYKIYNFLYYFRQLFLIIRRAI